MGRRLWLVWVALGVGCAEPQVSDPSSTSATTEPTGPSTAEILEDFYASHGGRDAFPDTATAALEAMLYGQDEVAAGDMEAARDRVAQIFEDMPLSTDIWRVGVGTDGTNIGDPIAYYGLRMLDLITEVGELPSTGTLRMTSVVALCAEVTRPTLPDLEPETVDLDVDPALLADDARALRVSTDLFRRWVTAITGGLEVELVVHEMSVCTTVDYTDDGALIVSYPDAYQMIASVPADIARDTDFWWVVAPSGVPGDGSGYDRHFITGGMGGYGAGLPLFLSDDAWFLRKPEHLGSGRYHEVEQRAYQPQWFQHEFMHHLFGKWPELELEVTSHQWFDRSTWPADFEGVYEADYYSEALEKRFGAVSPSVGEGLQGPDWADFGDIGLSAVAGDYRREPVLNEWHDVTVTVEGEEATWANAAGVAWSLSVQDGGLWAGPDCPYGEQELPVEISEDGRASVLWFSGEAYRRVD